jgi:hypothetical protein
VGEEAPEVVLMALFKSSEMRTLEIDALERERPCPFRSRYRALNSKDTIECVLARGIHNMIQYKVSVHTCINCRVRENVKWGQGL